MSAVLSAVFGAGFQSLNNVGQVNAGGMIYTYLAGSTTPQPTYTDSTQAVQNANPIVLDSHGRTPNEIWVANSTVTKFVLTDSNNNTLGTFDFIPGINSSNTPLSEWVAGLTSTYVSSTSFTVVGNNTSIYPINRRVQYSVTSGTYYGTITNSAYSAGTGLTTVTIMPDTTGLDSSLVTVNYGFLNAVNPSVPQIFVPILNPVFQGIVTIPAGALIAGYAQLAGAAFTGTVTGVTPAANDSSTNMATTAFVTAAAFSSNLNLPGQGSTSGQWLQTIGGQANWNNAFRKYETERVIRRARQLTFS